MSIGELIKRRREDLQLSQSELARRVKVTPSTISQVEANQKTPSTKLLQALADTLKVSSSFILEGDLDMSKADKSEFQVFFRKYKQIDSNDQEIIKQLMDTLAQKKKK